MKYDIAALFEVDTPEQGLRKYLATFDFLAREVSDGGEVVVGEAFSRAIKLYRHGAEATGSDVKEWILSGCDALRTAATQEDATTLGFDWLGLAVGQSMVGEAENAFSSLQKILKIPPPKVQAAQLTEPVDRIVRTAGTLLGSLISPIFGSFIGGGVAVRAVTSVLDDEGPATTCRRRVRRLATLKNAVRAYLQSVQSTTGSGQE